MYVFDWKVEVVEHFVSEFVDEGGFGSELGLLLGFLYEILTYLFDGFIDEFDDDGGFLLQGDVGSGELTQEKHWVHSDDEGTAEEVFPGYFKSESLDAGVSYEYGKVVFLQYVFFDAYIFDVDFTWEDADGEIVGVDLFDVLSKDVFEYFFEVFFEHGWGLWLCVWGMMINEYNNLVIIIESVRWAVRSIIWWRV